VDSILFLFFDRRYPPRLISFGEAGRVNWNEFSQFLLETEKEMKNPVNFV